MPPGIFMILHFKKTLLFAQNFAGIDNKTMPLSNEKAGLIGYANADKTVANRSAALDKSKFLKWLNLVPVT